MARLINNQTGEFIRAATIEELAQSVQAEMFGDSGAIEVDGVSCYVDNTPFLATDFRSTTTATQYDAQGYQVATNVSVQWIDADGETCEQVRIGRNVYRADEMRVEQASDGLRLVGPGGWYLID